MSPQEFFKRLQDGILLVEYAKQARFQTQASAQSFKRAFPSWHVSWGRGQVQGFVSRF